ncbi:MAG: D-beta-D-heptose 7-phosphate kinase / D-beta-D-heptose 1-phosphate adenosyltransferase [Frankiaceae bacterium]|jgi:rfaE bifunctional protein nucleotidyltransferase chain/domain/rfaE bifunctional protein kinase chain/domain|nr:D-beta-D-heptose 7-phosphate kinase / D-beta-D-heptose 1-phosphate adenosyltransferase [Frankiaceae bacterium]
MTACRLLVLGDTLLDRDVDGEATRLAPDAPVPVVDHETTVTRPGGAGLAAVLAAADGHEVRLLTALSADSGGGELRAALDARGVTQIDLGLDGPTPEKVRVRAGGRTLMRLDRGCSEPARCGPATTAARAAVAWADAVLVSDYGRGLAAVSPLRDALAQAVRRGVPVVWDPHPLGADPVPGAMLATPNERETRAFSPRAVPAGLHGALAAAQALLMRWQVGAICVTRAGAGALLAERSGAAAAFGARPAAGGDPCGAGDRFASRVTELLGTGAPLTTAIPDAVTAASAFVAAGGAGRAVNGDGPDEHTAVSESAAAVAERVRAQGGTVVATGGCFDLLHAGHVHTLQAARALGDCLLVCLNSDASVRRHKGPGRPIVGEHDRAAVLMALGCVDAVELFDEDTPVAALRRLRPDVWAKGGDYTVAELPEARVLADWGGRALVLPFVEGRSTTRLIEEVSLRAV